MNEEYCELKLELENTLNVLRMHLNGASSDMNKGIIYSIRNEIKRTIKRIDDEIEFLEDADVDGMMLYQFESIKERMKKLKKEKQLYELMEQLE